MSKLSNIINGWVNYVFPKKEVETLAKVRAKICAKCTEAKEGNYEILKDGELKEIQGMMCGLCKCPLSTKLRSEQEKCPIDKW